MSFHHPARPVALIVVVSLLLVLVAGCAAPFRGFESASMAPAAEAPAGVMYDQSTVGVDVMSVAQEGGAAPLGSSTNAIMARKMIARASVSMVVTNAEETVDEIEALLAEVGGFIANENLYNSGSSESPVIQGDLTLRVPAEALESTLDRLEGLAVQVGSRTLTREDVTDQYSDVDAQLRNLEATEAELREMLAEVRQRPNARPEDILAVHNRITEVRGQIEVLQGQKNLLDNLIGLSTIDVTLVPDAASLPVVEEGWRPAVVLREASRALVAALQGIGNFLIWFVVLVLPILLLLLLPVIVLIVLINWLIQRRKRRRAAAGAA